MWCTDSVNNNEQSSQLVSFSDASPGYTCSVSSQPDPTYADGVSPDSSLAQFLARPVVISSQTIAVGDLHSSTVYPWAAFLSSKRIANRVNNFRAISGNLRVKVVINGGPFYFGNFMLSYSPFIGSAGSSARPPIDSAFYSTDRSKFGNVVVASQRPHIYLDPGTSQGGVLELPFFWPKNGLALYDQTEWESMGELWLTSLTNLRHANNGTSPIQITMFAWMDDVKLMGPTKQNVDGLVPQSGSDEYSTTGPVSAAATAVQSLSARFMKAPLIGRYARATQMAAGAMADIARLFGLSRPRDVNNYAVVVPDYCGNMANANVTDYCTSLALDAKQETTIDPRTTGLSGVDEMAIDYLCAKESLVALVPWDPGYLPDHTITTLPVAPARCYFKANALATEPLYMSPMCWLSQMFTYWRGTITYRIMINASPNHKGRIMFGWDALESGNANNDTETNTQFTRIIDLAEERDVSITVGWGSEYPALGIRTLEPTSDISLLEPASFNTDNGKIFLRVLNPIVGPAPIADPIQIAIFAKSDSMSFYNLGIYYNKYWFTPQSGEGDHAKALEEGTSEPSKPQQTQSATTMGAYNLEPDATDSILAGETIRSLRTVLKRYMAAEGQVFRPSATPDDLNLYEIEMTRNSMPAFAGSSTYGPQDTETIHLTYMLPCFAAWRGSIRVKAATAGLRGRGGLHQLERFVYGTNVPDPPVVSNSLALGDLVSGSNIGTLVGSTGITLQPTELCPIVSAELPYYYFERFASARTSAATFTPSSFQYTIYCPGSDNSIMTQFFYAAGEDFSFYFFTGVPGALFT